MYSGRYNTGTIYRYCNTGVCAFRGFASFAWTRIQDVSAARSVTALTADISVHTLYILPIHNSRVQNNEYTVLNICRSEQTYRAPASASTRHDHASCRHMNPMIPTGSAANHFPYTPLLNWSDMPMRPLAIDGIVSNHMTQYS